MICIRDISHPERDLFIRPLSCYVVGNIQCLYYPTNDNQPIQKITLKMMLERGQRGIESGTSGTRSENHPTRPLSRYVTGGVQCFVQIFETILGVTRMLTLKMILKQGQREFESGSSVTRSENHTTRPLSRYVTGGVQCVVQIFETFLGVTRLITLKARMLRDTRKMNMGHLPHSENYTLDHSPATQLEAFTFYTTPSNDS